MKIFQIRHSADDNHFSETPISEYAEYLIWWSASSNTLPKTFQHFPTIDAQVFEINKFWNRLLGTQISAKGKNWHKPCVLPTPFIFDLPQFQIHKPFYKYILFIGIYLLKVCKFENGPNFKFANFFTNRSYPSDSLC